MTYRAGVSFSGVDSVGEPGCMRGRSGGLMDAQFTIEISDFELIRK